MFPPIEHLAGHNLWNSIRHAANNWMARSGGLWLAILSLIMLITTPWWVEKAITNAMQSKTHQSALQYAQQLSARLDAAQTHYDRAVSATDSPRDDFEPIARQWLKNSSHVLRVQLLDANGHVLKSFTRQEGDAHDPTTFKPLNRISLAHALELQTPTYSALYKQHDQQVVDLFIPHDGPSPVAYVLTLDTQPWTQVTGENKETLLTVEVVPYQTQNFLDVSRYILNFPEWEGLWSLQFQSADPMLGILSALRPAFFVVTLMVIVLFFLHWRDFQLRQKTEAQLQKQSRLLDQQSRLSMLGEMSASLAHEINQPLTSIANYAVAGQLQLQRHDAQSPVLPLLQKIQEQSQRAAQVLVAVRGMTQPGPMDVAEVNLQALFFRMEPHLLWLCSQHQVALHIQCDAQWRTLLNPILFEQVILNLVKNSIQALDSITHSSKRIRIQVTGDQEMLHIQVADNGPGIQPENVPRIFDSFFTTKAQGLGIGLKLCRSVIERLNGRLTLKNNSPRGVGFMISLPLLSDTTQQAQPT
ncbi:sensor histidine kinase [Limnohabitans planktonicus]|uniref:histidine kinase n=1 Tax=Limnohabitans planktonicus II-D5 TaxID=1293045 RepID=A0A2T7UIE2_9BURK|nr:ATP-binding protein [Limnohabitans planktonicus]PVE44450.1 two-component sensor histidine kinase [Limnohabitans planktonicus II-D5]